MLSFVAGFTENTGQGPHLDSLKFYSPKFFSYYFWYVHFINDKINKTRKLL